MTTSQVFILTLTYSINFHDADDGDCYAGEGREILSVHADRATANAIVSEFTPVFAQAGNEDTIFPIQKFNRMLKNKFGFTTHDFNDAYNFKLVVEAFNIEP